MSDRSRASRDTRSRPHRVPRADKAVETERRLIDAAARIVGAEGYANASVAKITALADVAQGTFYNYFASQQDLFDHLLPELGGQLLDFVRERVAGIEDSFAREEAGFLAFFEFLNARPEFYRILNEAETFSPTAFRAHMQNMAQGYVRALARSHAKGEMPGFAPRELEVIVYTLLAARNYIAYRYVSGEGRARSLPAWVVEAYMKLVTGGMRYGGTARRPPRVRGKSTDAAAARSGALSPRIEASEPGRAELTVDVEDQDKEPDGTVRSAVLVELLEAAGAHVVGDDGARSPRLRSMSVSYIAPVAASTLVAIARLEGGAEARHVAVRIADAASPAETLVMAQAVYAAEASGMGEGRR